MFIVVVGEERKVGQGRNVGETAWEQRTAEEHVLKLESGNIKSVIKKIISRS